MAKKQKKTTNPINNEQIENHQEDNRKSALS